MPTDSIAVILLAAGASARMGEPKQLLRFQGETLLRRSAKIALAVSAKVVVTLGANARIFRREIEDLPIGIAENENWKSGMSGSVKCGLKKLLTAENQLEAVIVMVCDQPFADEILLSEIVEKFEQSDSLIVASRYADTLGVPALFSSKLFPELLAPDAANGAKHLIEKYKSETAAISFPEGAFDVDTPIDYENLVKNFD